MALDQSQAREVARQAILAIGAREGFAPMILDEQTIESPLGWLFSYDSREFVETRNPASRLIGNAPVIVMRDNGAVFGKSFGEDTSAPFACAGDEDNFIFEIVHLCFSTASCRTPESFG